MTILTETRTGHFEQLDGVQRIRSTLAFLFRLHRNHTEWIVSSILLAIQEFLTELYSRL